MTGTHLLEASDKAVFNILYEHVHNSGRILDPMAEWEMPLTTLRQAYSRHGSNDRLRETLVRLQSVNVMVKYIDDDGDQREVITKPVRFLRHPHEGTN